MPIQADRNKKNSGGGGGGGRWGGWRVNNYEILLATHQGWSTTKIFNFNRLKGLEKLAGGG